MEPCGMATNQSQFAVPEQIGEAVEESLTNTTTLVIGGSSELKRTLLRAFVAADATVIVPNDDALPDVYDSKEVIVTDEVLNESRIERVQAAERLRDEVCDRVGELNAVVAVPDSVWTGDPLVETSTEAWHMTLDEELAAPFVLARTLLPVLAENSGRSSYTFINQPMGEMPTPYAGASAVAAAGRRMAVQMMMQEATNDTESVRVNELMPYLPEKTGPYTHHGTGTITRAEVARVATALIAPSSDTHGELIRLREPRDVRPWTVDEEQ